MKYLRHEMDLPSLIRYAGWRKFRSRTACQVRLKSGVRLELRPQPYGDLFCAQEIFVEGVYRCPRPEALLSAHTILDLGANIGLSCVHWARLCESAKIVAFEPHPVHIRMLKRHIELNHLQGRIKLFEGAAGLSDGASELSDDSLRSSLIKSDDARPAVRVKVFDLYQVMKNEAIDVMKMDIEGYEYSILQDPRISSLLPRTIVMEWHNTEAFPDGERWCRSRLSELGYQVVQGNDEEPNTGILWAFR